MEFEFSKAQKEIINAAREFAKGEFDPDLCLTLDRESRFPDAIFKKACRLGFIGIHLPEELSGQGMGLLDFVLVAEALCRQDSTLGAGLCLSLFGAEYLSLSAEADLKKKILPKIIQGKTRIGTQLFSETDPTAFPKAFKEEGRWIVNGRADRIINGKTADFFLILCRTGQDNPDQNVLSLVLIENSQKGISTDSSAPPMGLHASGLANIVCDRVEFPETQFIGPAGSGILQTEKFMIHSCIQMAAIGLGIAQGAFDRALAFAREREQFGSKLTEFQTLRHYLAAMNVDIRRSRLMTCQAAAAVDRGNMDIGAAAAAKLSACRTAREVSDRAVQILGGYGYMAEYHVERCYRDAKLMEIIGGSPNRLYDIISRKVIGAVRAA